jgi:hypothetical protein
MTAETSNSMYLFNSAQKNDTGTHLKICENVQTQKPIRTFHHLLFGVWGSGFAPAIL